MPFDQSRASSSIGGWLLVLCVLLLVWQPLSLALIAAAALDKLIVRGLPMALVLMLRIAVTAFGIAAALAVMRRRPAGIGMLRISLLLSAGTDLFVYATPHFPSNRMPGDTAYYVAGTLVYYALWMRYLARSRRVRAFAHRGQADFP